MTVSCCLVMVESKVHILFYLFLFCGVSVINSRCEAESVNKPQQITCRPKIWLYHCKIKFLPKIETFHRGHYLRLGYLYSNGNYIEGSITAYKYISMTLLNIVS